MKEIKFRAWNAVSNKMIKDVLHLEGQEHNNFGNVLKDKTKIVMQYIGKEDKNKIEIFEKDIAKVYFDINKLPDYLYYDLTEEEKQNGFFIVLVEEIPHCYLNSKLWAGEIEIIGNIHENPEEVKVKTSPGAINRET